MRILSITSDPGAGGSSKSLLNLIKGLSALGHEVTVMLPCKGYLSDKLDNIGIQYIVNRYITINVWPPVYNLVDALHFPKRLLILWLFNTLSRKKLREFIRLFSPDIIHSNNSLISIGYNEAKRLNIKHIWHVREYGDMDFGLKFYPSNEYRLKILKSTPSISITHDLSYKYGLENSGEVIYNGVLSVKDVTYNPVKDDYFLYVGRITDSKGVTDLIQGLIGYYNKGGRSKLVLVGSYDEKYKERLLTMLLASDLPSGLVDFVGQSDSVKEYMTKAKALIVPSKYEAFGRITAEAMFYGCLVIGRNTGGTKEQFDLGRCKTGQEIALRFETAEQLAQQMTDVEIMPMEEKEKYIYTAQEFAKQNFSTERNIILTNRFFEKTLNN